MSEFGGVRRVLSAFFDAEIDVFKGYRGKIFAIAINRFVNFVVVSNFIVLYSRFLLFAVDAFGGRAVDTAAAGKNAAVFVFGIAAGTFAARKNTAVLRGRSCGFRLDKAFGIAGGNGFSADEKGSAEQSGQKEKRFNSLLIFHYFYLLNLSAGQTAAQRQSLSYVHFKNFRRILQVCNRSC